MDKINLHILTPNKFKKRYFGVDYFMNILSGYNPQFKYCSTSIDQNPVYQDIPITFLPEKYDFLKAELADKETGSIIGIQNNPDIYEGLESIGKILSILKEYKMGLYLETSSARLLNDLEVLKDFAKECPLLIAIPCPTSKVKSVLFGDKQQMDVAVKLIQKIKQSGILVGMLVKPIVPYINDDIKSFKNLVQAAINAGADFVYPSFSIKFDTRKLKAFYDVIDLEYPEMMNRFKDSYGQKTVWASPNIQDLKKQYVILTRKYKVLYAMKDIINLYKPDLNIQLKLF